MVGHVILVVLLALLPAPDSSGSPSRFGCRWKDAEGRTIIRLDRHQSTVFEVHSREGKWQSVAVIDPRRGTALADHDHFASVSTVPERKARQVQTFDYDNSLRLTQPENEESDEK